MDVEPSGLKQEASPSESSPSQKMKKQKVKKESRLPSSECFDIVASGIQKVLLLSKNEGFRQRVFGTLGVDNAGDAKTVLVQNLNAILEDHPAGVAKGGKPKTASADLDPLGPVPAVPEGQPKTEEPDVKIEEEANSSQNFLINFD